MTSGLVAGSEDHNRGFKRIVYLLIWLVIVPTALLIALGIVTLVFWEELRLLFGILVTCLISCLVTGSVLALVWLRREANLSKLQTDFVSKVSHELRTPLTSIRMFAEMLQDGKRDAKQTAICLEVLHKETIRLSERIERLLDWGRMEAGRRIYDHTSDTPEAIVADALSTFHSNRFGREQEIDVELAPDLPTVLVDREALVDALVNLLSNAVKYSGDDKKISIGAQADKRFLRIFVRDNGDGIPRVEHKRIFQKFYRADDRLSRDVEGSGLGLAIVGHVVAAHRGRIEVESAPGRGSTFTLVLPIPSERKLRQNEEAALQAATPPAESVESASAPELGSEVPQLPSGQGAAPANSGGAR